MHARVTTVTITGERHPLEPGTIDEAIDLWDAEVADEISSRKGFIEAMLLVRRNTNTIVQIGLWQTEEDMMRLEKDGVYNNLVGKFCDLIVDQPEKEYFEICRTLRAKEPE